jgi:putative hydrolase of the HAD superfamily
MNKILNKNYLVVFDLDDTLYPERSFEKSGIEYVFNFLQINSISLESLLENRSSWVDIIVNNYHKSILKESVLDLYRNHQPDIYLYNDAKVLLKKLISSNIEMSLITDGRSITQRNKLKSLEIEHYFKDIIISEELKSCKPSEINFKNIMKSNINEYVYIGDNTSKDFITPNKLGWKTICLLNRGENVHNQNFNLPKEYLPQHIIKSFDEIRFNHEI